MNLEVHGVLELCLVEAARVMYNSSMTMCYVEYTTFLTVFSKDFFKKPMKIEGHKWSSF